MDEMDVLGPDGDDIGSVENLIVDPDGQLLSIIAEVGGFLDIGDTHVNAPWDEADVSFDDGTVTIPVTQETVEEYSLFADEGTIQASTAGSEVAVVPEESGARRAWKASELMGDYARLTDGAGYGYVNDLLFGMNGQLMAVVITPYAAYGPGGYYAYPYRGYDGGFDPGRGITSCRSTTPRSPRSHRSSTNG